MSISDDVLEEAAAALGDLLRERGLLLTTAESCTGGWVAKALTDRAGSSDYVHSGLVTYSNEAKRVLLEVTDKSLTEHGAVSEPVVREMVAGALAATGAHVAVSVSGVAGKEYVYVARFGAAEATARIAGKVDIARSVHRQAAARV